MTLEILQDQDTQSPADWGDESLRLAVLPGCRTRLRGVPVASWDRAFWRFPVVEARRSDGIRLADKAREMRGCSLVIQASRAEWPTMEKARKAAESLVETWNQWISGEVYGYVITEGEVHIDSCYGFYGEDEAKRAGREALEHFEKHSDLHVTI